MRFAGPARVRFTGDPALAQLYLPEARGYLGVLVNRLALGGVEVGSWAVTNGAGVVFRLFVFGPMQLAMEIDVTRAKNILERDIAVLVVCCGAADSVAFVNLETEQIIEHIDCGADSFPFGVATTPDGMHAVVSCNAATDNVKIFFVPTRKLVVSLTISTGVPFGVCCPDNTTAFIADDSGYVNKIDIIEQTVTPSTQMVDSSMTPIFGEHIACTPDKSKLYIPSTVLAPASGGIGVMDVETLTPLTIIPVPFVDHAVPPTVGVTVTRDGETAVVTRHAGGNSKVYLIDVESDTITTSITKNLTLLLPANEVLNAPLYVVQAPSDSNHIYISSRSSHTVDVIDLENQVHSHSLEMFGDPFDSGVGPLRGLALHPKLSRGYVVRQSQRKIAVFSLLDSFERKRLIGLFDGEPWGIAIATRRESTSIRGSK